MPGKIGKGFPFELCVIGLVIAIVALAVILVTKISTSVDIFQKILQNVVTAALSVILGYSHYPTDGIDIPDRLWEVLE
jgi:hypothetical protein